MPILNFPSNPTLNQVYSFNGKTWIWNGQGWAIDKEGAINGVVIGNVVPESGGFTTLTANTVSATGNITGDYFIGNGSQLTGLVTNKIFNGTSNVSIPTSNGNVSVVVDGNSVATFSSGGASVVGNVKTGNLNAAGLSLSGNVVSPLSVTGNVTAPFFIGNVVGNITGNISVPGSNTDVIFNDDGLANASTNFTYNKTTQVLNVTGNVDATAFNGSGVGLTYTMVNHGSDPNNWNALLQMGTYTVNRVNWGGVSGPPLDSLVYVGLLSVSSSNSTPGVQAVQQVFTPGTVDPTNIKIQWVRSYWSGSWTPWVRMTNDVQQIDGGTF